MTGSIEDPSGIQDLLLFRMSKILEGLGEGERKQLNSALDSIHQKAIELAEGTDLPKAHRRRGRA